MKEEELKELAEEVAQESPLSEELDQPDLGAMEDFIGKMGNVYKAQYEGYKGKPGLGTYLAFILHEGIQLGLKIAIVNRRLERRQL